MGPSSRNCRGGLVNRFIAPSRCRVRLGRGSAAVLHPAAGHTYLCISLAEDRMPRHSSNMMPTMARVSRKRVLVNNTHRALVGGNCALADFQVMPPLGRSMVTERGRALRVALYTTPKRVVKDFGG